MAVQAVQENLEPTHNVNIILSMKAESAVKHISFECTEARPSETLYVSVPKLNEDEVLVPGSLALLFDIDSAGGDENNFLVPNVTRALVDKMAVKYAGTILQDTVGYDIFKIWEGLFLSQEKWNNMLLEGIQSEDLCKIRSSTGDKETSGVETENKLNMVYGTK